jgi:glycosyltransferase involved in cell wall biosynthesis
MLYELGEIGYNVAGVMLLLKEAFRNRPDFLYERYSLYNLSAGIAGRLMNIPTILEVNAPLALERSTQPDEKLIFREWGKWFEREAFHRASGIVVVSSPLRDYIISLGIDPWKILVLANGVDEVRFEPRAKDLLLMRRYGIPPERKVIGFSGIFRSWHGIDLLLDAFGIVCGKGFPVHLLLIGDGPLRGWIEDRVASGGLGNLCTITGRIPHTDMPDVTSLLDIAVSPRATFYASPMKIIEYMALGKAVVAPNAENIRDIITDGEDGILFPGERTESLADAITSLLGDDTVHERICRRARETVEVRLNWRANAQVVTDWVGGRGWKRD